MSDASPQSAYVHVPFCRHRCGYCNFTVIAGRDDLIADYLRAIEIELSSLAEPKPVKTLFLGGGTPTHLSCRQLSQFLELVSHWFPLDDNGEFSVEANPEDIDAETVAVLSEAGVNRVSLGVQSFREEKLKQLERSHLADDIASGVRQLRVSIRSISLDLIFGAPHETLAQWQEDVRLALQTSPDHLSTYGLTYEEGTSFHTKQRRGELQGVGEDAELEMYEWVIDELQGAGWEHYEVSNFARPNHRCRHNERYWFCDEFYGIGPGAASYVDGCRRTNYRSTTKYLQAVLAGRSPVSESEALHAKDAAHERLVFGLRRLDGIALSEFENATGYSIPVLVGEPLQWLMEQGLLACDRGVLRLTRRGLLVSDSIWPHLL